MSDQFLGEIRIFGFNFAPSGWAFCDGQILPLSQNTALFSLLGTTYGGDGKSTFALPNFQNSAPLQPGQGPGLSFYNLGEVGGESTVTLLTSQIPVHSHTPLCVNGAGSSNSPVGNILASDMVGRQGESRYTANPGTGPTLSPQALQPTGSNQPHNNMPPYLALNFCIALTGIYPSRS
jgi:microcystin-dependent protein